MHQDASSVLLRRVGSERPETAEPRPPPPEAKKGEGQLVTVRGVSSPGSSYSVASGRLRMQLHKGLDLGGIKWDTWAI